MLTSSLWSILASGGAQVFSFVVFVQIARMVGPQQFGLVALAALLIDLMQTVSAGGVSDAVIQRAELSDRDSDTAFWANAGSGVVFFALAFAAAEPLASLFRTPDLGWVIRTLSVTFLITPFGAIHSARLARSFGFRALAIRSLASNLISGVVAVGVALAGGGVMALIVQRLLSAASMAAISWLSFRWTPQPRFDPAAFRGMAQYGLKTMGAQTLQQLSTRAVELIAGVALGPVAVGTIRVANRCVEMLVQLTVLPFQQVALPMLARSQSSVGSRRATYLHLSRLSGVLIFPAFGGAFALAPTILPLAFGPQWQASVGLMQIILLAGVALQCSVMVPAALGAAGYPGQLLGLALAQLVLAVVLCSVGSVFGATGLVAANVARAYVMLPFSLWLLRRKCGVGADVALGSIARPLATAGVMTAGVMALDTALRPQLPPMATLALCIAAGGALYAAGAMLLMRDTLHDLGGLLPFRARSWLQLRA